MTATTHQNADSGPNEAALVTAYLNGASAPCGAATQTDRWRLTVDALRGEPLPPLPDLPGQVHQCHDEPLAEDDLAGIKSATELARLLGVSRQRAHQILNERAAKAHTATEGTEP